jgi:CotH kinase protein/Lamin Tail Domain
VTQRIHTSFGAQNQKNFFATQHDPHWLIFSIPTMTCSSFSLLWPACLHVYTFLVCLSLNRHNVVVTSSIIISEIAGKGSANVCGDGGNNEDWLELHNTDPSGEQPVSLAGYILHDDKGITGDHAFSFPLDYDVLLPGEYRLICTNDSNSSFASPQFAIGGDDTLTLVSSDGSTVVASVGPLPDHDAYNGFNITYAWDSETNGFQYTSTPTPGSSNILTPVVEQTNEAAMKKIQLAQQNELGTHFFGMDSQGYPVDGALDPVLDLHLTMNDDELQEMMKNKYSEVYYSFQSVRLTTARLAAGGAVRGREQEDEILSRTSPGRIRTKGLSSLFLAACMGTTTVPFQIEFNSSETLFGVETLFLRNHFLDPTYMRDWSMNRMLARFGLPYLRARKIRFLINQEYIGFYTAVEAPQEYVFARSFPNYNPFNYSLYKWKADAIGCGRYDPDVLADAEASKAEPPYSFERGSHRPTPPIYGKAGFPLCMEAFAEFHFKAEKRDQATLYLQYDKNCGEMLVEEGLMDRDLGTGNWDSGMKDFVNKYLTQTLVDDRK